MEDLWKVTRLDYRIAAIAEQGVYEEIVRRYHHEEAESSSPPALKKTAHSKILTQE